MVVPRMAAEPLRGPRAVVSPLPPPVGGLNDYDSLAAMPSTDAIRMVNWFPSTTTVNLRKGCSDHCDTGETTPVRTLAELKLADGTSKLLAIVNHKGFDVSTGTHSDLTFSTSPTVDTFQTMMMSQRLLLFNGTDKPKNWDGGATINDTSYTMPSSIADTDLVQAVNHRNRLYAVAAGHDSYVYGGSNAYSGALTEVSLTTVLKKGGSLHFVATWSFDDGSGLDDYLVIMSSEGELLIYDGSYPGDSGWTKTAQFFLPKPICRQGFVNWGKDLLIFTEGGIFSMGYLMSEGMSSQNIKYLSQKIQNTVRGAATLYAGNYGWQPIVYYDGPWLLLNVPIAEGSRAEQYVMNLDTRAWTKFEDWRAICWAVFNGDLYYGGYDGHVYQANYGTTDNGAAITTDLKTAFYPYKYAGNVKLFNLVRPLVASTGVLSVVLDMDVDYEDQLITDTATVTGVEGAEWDVGAWDTADWDADLFYNTDWKAVTAMGNVGAIRMKASFEHAEVQLSGFQVSFIVGGTF